MSRALEVCFQILCTLSGLAIAALGVNALVANHSVWGPVVINVYVTLFGLVLVVKELCTNEPTRWFAFLNDWAGVGLYLIFLGSLAATQYATTVFWFYIAVGICGLGVLAILVKLLAGGSPKSAPLLG
eukprot:TRINITY_DN15676_c0_g1_i1.p1 TRINITY_DN15676_c0_g1~~TRINITY_DN15676_c0_g1_i1.p1  ORF type:complete len:142 (-),score=31.13 TRINITY_DN15676_c0_g1_i1:111-494(-)